MDGAASTRFIDHDRQSTPANTKARSGGRIKGLRPLLQPSPPGVRQAIALTAEAICLNDPAKFCQNSAGLPQKGACGSGWSQLPDCFRSYTCASAFLANNSFRTISAPAPKALSFPLATLRDRGAMPQLVEG